MHPTLFTIPSLEQESTLFCERVLDYPRSSLLEIYGTHQWDRQIILAIHTYRIAAQMLLDHIASIGISEVVQKIRWISEISGDLDDDWYDRLIFRAGKCRIPER